MVTLLTHLLALLPLLGVFLIVVFLWRKGLGFLAVVAFSMAMILYMFYDSWEWYTFPIVAIIGLISLYAFLRKAMDGELV